MSILQKQGEIAKLKIKKMRTGDRSIETFIDLANYELEMLKSNTSGEQDFYESKVTLEKICGHQINIMLTTVTEYYSLIRLMEKQKPASNG